MNKQNNKVPICVHLQTKKHADVIIPRGADNTGMWVQDTLEVLNVPTNIYLPTSVPTS